MRNYMMAGLAVGAYAHQGLTLGKRRTGCSRKGRAGDAGQTVADLGVSASPDRKQSQP